MDKDLAYLEIIQRQAEEIFKLKDRIRGALYILRLKNSKKSQLTKDLLKIFEGNF